MIELAIDSTSPVPVYRQIVDGLRVLLVDGELRPDDQLPPVRQMALDLGVHFNTVAQAYRTLAEEGWLRIGRRSGAHVVSRAAPAAQGAKADEILERRLRGLVAELEAGGAPRSRIASELLRLAETLERT
jgi:GntR family transcriptional regulator